MVRASWATSIVCVKCMIIIAFKNDKDLRLVFQLAKGLAVNDAVTVSLISRASRMIGLLVKPPDGILALHGIRGKDFTFLNLQSLFLYAYFNFL